MARNPRPGDARGGGWTERLAPLSGGVARRPLLALCLAAGLASATPALAAVEPASAPAVSASAVDPREPRLYVLAFSDAAMDDVASEVLGTALRLPFDVDPDLRGRMDLHVEERLTPDQLLAVFSEALAAKGGAVIRTGGRLILMPAAKARRLGLASAAAATTPRFERAPRLAHQPRPSARRPDFALWIVLAGAAGAAIALAGVAAWSRVRIGSFRRAEGPREAVMAHILAGAPIAPDALSEARRRSEDIRQPLEQTLNQMGQVSDEALVQAYAAVTGCAIWRPSAQPALASPGACGASADFLRLRGLAPVALEERSLVLAAIDPLDDEAIAQLAAVVGRPVTILVGAPADVRRALQAN